MPPWVGRTFITGTLARTDNGIGIRVELIDARSQGQIWSDDFVRDARAVVDVQRQVVRDIVRETRINITSRQHRRLKAEGRQIDPQIHEMLAKARFHNARIDYVVALALYEQVQTRARIALQRCSSRCPYHASVRR